MSEPPKTQRDSDRFNNAIAIIVALISAFLAVASVKGDNVVQAMQRSQELTTNSWNQYQAKRLRHFALELELRRADALSRDGLLKDTPENRALVEEWRKDLVRYEAELKELSAAANGHKAEYDRLNGADDLLDFSGSFLSLALALLAVAALTRIGWLLGLSAAVSLVGLGFGLAAFAGLDLVRPEWLSRLLGA